MIRITPALVGLLILCAGCGEPRARIDEPASYAANGLSFQMPGNWKVSEDTDLEGARYLFVESPGDAILIIQLFPGDAVEEDLEAFARDFAASSAASTSGAARFSASRFSETTGPDGLPGLEETFTISLLGQRVPHTRIYHRRDFGKTACFLISQVADEDAARVGAGFDLVISSLDYTPPPAAP